MIEVENEYEPEGEIVSLVETHEGYILVATKRRVYVKHRDTGVFHAIPFKKEPNS